MRYKEGDTVQIKSLEWFNQNKKDNTFAMAQGYRVEHPDYSYVFITPMAEYCGKEAIISTCDETLGIYKLKIDNIDNIYNWCDFMLEDINVNNMKEKTIKVTLEKAQKWYTGRNKTLKELALQVFTEEELKDTLPNTWEEFCEKNPKGKDFYHPKSIRSVEDRIKELAKAGALITAEIDRLYRVKERVGDVLQEVQKPLKGGFSD